MAMERDEMEMIGRFQRLGLYYTLGGAHAVPPSLGDMLRVKPLPGFQVGGGYSCGKFDFRHQMQDILGWLEGLLLPLGLLWVVYAAGGYAVGRPDRDRDGDPRRHRRHGARHQPPLGPAGVC